VFLALYRNLQSIDAGQLPAWLFTVAKNRAVDYWRHCELEQRYAAAAADPVVLPESSREHGLFESTALKPIHRLCLILRYVHGMDRAEIAQRTGLSDNQIKSSLQYARQLLRKQLLGDAR
jgi:RNA polymerase sigma-70 factor (ECF subfamily)